MNLTETGIKLIDNLLSRDGFMYYHVDDVHAIHYAEACAALGALRLAGLLDDSDRLDRLVKRYSITEVNTANHVDANVWGIVPLELYNHTGDRSFLEQGLFFADGQWKAPLENGMTNQTRFWIDDIYMIASLQAQAFRATGESIYLERAALEVEAYVKKLQRPEGLFYHGPDAPFFWGRGNGWVAVGLAELLSVLPKEHGRYPVIAEAFALMTKALCAHQRADGMWNQLVDKEYAWPESSASAMFAYALAIGGDRSDRSRSDCALDTLVGLLDAGGNLADICAGTGQSRDERFYLERPRITGDLHGQAALLWLIAEKIKTRYSR